MANNGGKGSRKSDKLFVDELRKVALEPVDPKDPKSIRKLRRVATRLMEKAIEGDVAAIKEVADRLDGKVKQTVGHENSEGGNLLDGASFEIKVIHAGDKQ